MQRGFHLGGDQRIIDMLAGALLGAARRAGSERRHGEREHCSLES